MMDAKKLMAEGLAFVCATCVKMERGLQRGKDQCEAGLLGKPCGGPGIGLGYPEYEGPLTRAQIGKTCFRCGVDAPGGFETPDGLVGACEAHRRTVGGDGKLVAQPVAGVHG